MTLIIAVAAIIVGVFGAEARKKRHLASNLRGNETLAIYALCAIAVALALMIVHYMV